jgi:hypothetical protein
MTKSVFSDQPLSSNELDLYNESCVAGALAQHYQGMADKHNEQAVRLNNRFWDTIRKNHPFPKTPCMMELNGTRTMLVFKPMKRDIQRTIVLQPKRPDDIKFIRPKE